MSKPCYEEYVNHAMRFYARNPVLNMKAPGLSKIDIQNWNTCDETLRAFTEQEQNIVLNVYRSKCTMSEAIREIASQLRTNEDGIWQLMNKLSRTFAKNRGLI